MGRRGPPPKPTAVRRREGNPRNRALPNEPEPPPVEKIPDPPEHLSEVAAEVWRYLARVLKDSDLLTQADLYPLEMFCDQYAEWREALKLRREMGRIIEIEKDGEIVNTYESPASKLCRNLAADCNRWFKVLGLGPAYRVGLSTTAPDGDGIDDPLAAAIANG